MTYHSEIFNLHDGGTCLLDWYFNKQVNGDKASRVNPLMVIVPGLTGNSTNLYITSVIVECEKQGYDAVVINYRCNAGLLPTVSFNDVY